MLKIGNSKLRYNSAMYEQVTTVESGEGGGGGRERAKVKTFKKNTKEIDNRLRGLKQLQLALQLNVKTTAEAVTTVEKKGGGEEGMEKNL